MAGVKRRQYLRGRCVSFSPDLKFQSALVTRSCAWVLEEAQTQEAGRRLSMLPLPEKVLWSSKCLETEAGPGRQLP